MHLARRVFPVVSVVVSPTLPENGGLATGLACEAQAVLYSVLPSLLAQAAEGDNEYLDVLGLDCIREVQGLDVELAFAGARRFAARHGVLAVVPVEVADVLSLVSAIEST